MSGLLLNHEGIPVFSHRDLIAIEAMKSLLGQLDYSKELPNVFELNQIAERSYVLADEMLREREIIGQEVEE